MVAKAQNYIIDDYNDDEHWRDVQRQVGIIGNSEKVRELLEIIEQVAPTDISVLISGESGTGKELVAKAVHMRSRRRDEPLITVNCAAIPEGILESELFGHEKGSFTGAAGQRKGYFELANKGSIFLDEIGELPLSIQVKLLRVLEEREFMRVGGTSLQAVDVRFIAATNRDLEEEVKKENFRQDLYYRLNAVHIHVPALRERREDIVELAQKFAADFSRANLIEFKGFSERAFFLLQDYSWPGNIRELRNLVEKMIVLEKGNFIDETVLQKYIKPSDEFDKKLPMRLEKPKDELEREFLLRVLLEIKSEISQLRELMLAIAPKRYSLGEWRDELPNEYAADGAWSESDRSPESVSDMEKEMIRATLKKTGGNKRKTAKILGLSERTLYRKINKYGLRDHEE
ncbi:sigma-54-dependent Fis family transcriptional regulator [candidate division KSB1 bacterium]|nr:sigma-54-dependent Fis family transcriptional regulator [candidate division KSB1 bacterium]RQV99885.1 MAG: sigma-54-dependent Fis family transcriptional regulator [candidate division KSB1 bacterium]